MKRSFKTLIILAVLSVAFVMSANAQVGIQAGFVSSKNKAKVGSSTIKSDANNGFNIGLTYDYDFNNYLGIQTGLLYSMVIGKEEVLVTTIKETGHYATIPINLKGMYPIGNSGLGVFAFAGPDIILGIAGKTKTEGGFSGGEEYNWYEDGSNQNRFDLALGMGAGIQYNNLRIKFGYDLGLLNLLDTNGDDGKYTRNHFNISLGFLF